MDKVLYILKIVMQLISFVKKMFSKQTKNSPKSIDLSESILDKLEKK